jgi:hypothetical protein
MDRLSADLVPYISDASASLILAHVTSANWSQQPNQTLEKGTIELQVDEVFQGGSLRPGEHFTISGERPSDPDIRFLNLRDQWNAIPFVKGDLLLMAVRAVTRANVVPLAAIQVHSKTDPEVGALRQACEISRVQDAAQRRALLRQALESPQDLLFRYALDDLGHHQTASREQGAEMIVQAIFSKGISRDSRSALVNALTGRSYYEYELGAEPVNKLVIATLARLLAEEKNPKDLGVWTTFLSSSLSIQLSKDPVKDKEMRDALIRSVPEPTRKQVPAKLAEAAQLNPADPRIPMLIKAWKTAQ